MQQMSLKFSQPQSITQKGVHARPLTAREREHWFLQHLSHFLAAIFVRYFGALENEPLSKID